MSRVSGRRAGHAALARRQRTARARAAPGGVAWRCRTRSGSTAAGAHHGRRDRARPVARRSHGRRAPPAHPGRAEHQSRLAARRTRDRVRLQQSRTLQLVPDADRREHRRRALAHESVEPVPYVVVARLRASSRSRNSSRSPAPISGFSTSTRANAGRWSEPFSTKRQRGFRLTVDGWPTCRTKAAAGRSTSATPADAAHVLQASANGGRWPCWSVDGRTLYFRRERTHGRRGDPDLAHADGVSALRDSRCRRHGGCRQWPAQRAAAGAPRRWSFIESRAARGPGVVRGAVAPRSCRLAGYLCLLWCTPRVLFTSDCRGVARRSSPRALSPHRRPGIPARRAAVRRRRPARRSTPARLPLVADRVGARDARGLRQSGRRARPHQPSSSGLRRRPGADERTWSGSTFIVAVSRWRPGRMKKRCPALDVRQASRALILEGVNNPDNVGGIFRSAAAFGVDLVVLGPDCGDPFIERPSAPRWPRRSRFRSPSRATGPTRSPHCGRRDSPWSR